MRHNMLKVLIAFFALSILAAACGSTDSNGNGDNAAEGDEPGGADVQFECPSDLSEVKELRMMESGGTSGDSIEEAYIKPFTEATGIKVVRDSPWSMGQLQAMVESGEATYDLYELGMNDVVAARELGLIQPIDWDHVAPEPIYDDVKFEDALGYQYVSVIMVWRDGVKAPQNWVDFFDTENFPGKRALSDYPSTTLYAAAMGGGADPSDLDPLDLDLAFETLERVKDDVDVWWQAGAQPPQLLKDGEVDYAIAWHGRVVDEDGLNWSFQDAPASAGMFTIPKNVDQIRKCAAERLLYEFTVPENNLVAAEIVPYTGPSVGLSDILPADLAPKVTTSKENRAVAVTVAPEWWADNVDMIQERWEQFKLGL